MFSIFLYRKNTCHIRKCNIRLILHPVPEKIKVHGLSILVILSDTKNSIPFIQNDYKLMPGFSVKFIHTKPEIRNIVIHSGIYLIQFIQNTNSKLFYRISYADVFFYEIGHNDTDNIKPTNVFVPFIQCFSFGKFQLFE